MTNSACDVPYCSQQSSSDLSEPPDFTEEETTQFAAKMAPQTRSRGEAKGNISANSSAKPNGDSALSIEQSINAEPASGNGEAAPENEAAPRRASRCRVPSKRHQFTLSQAASSSTAPAPKRLKMSTKKWTPEYVTQNKQSPLANKDLRALLLHPGAWDVLSDEDKKELLDLFPDTRHILHANTPDARPNVMSLQNDDNFRHDTEEYVSNLKAGMHDPTWLRDAWAAHEARAAGQFDDYYIRKLELDWKTTIPDELKPEHLRPAPKPELKPNARTRPQTGDQSSADQLIRDEGPADDAQVKAADNSLEAKGPVGLDEISDSITVKFDTRADEDAMIEVDMVGLAADESSESVRKGFQRVSVGSVGGTVNGNPDKMCTAKV